MDEVVQWIRAALTGKLGVFRLDVMDMPAFPSIVIVAVAAFLGVLAVSPIVACGKKGPLYLPDAKLTAPTSAKAVSVPVNNSVQERR